MQPQLSDYDVSVDDHAPNQSLTLSVKRTLMENIFHTGHEPPNVSLLHRVFTQHVPDGPPAEGRVIRGAVQPGATDGLQMCGAGLLGWGRWIAHHLPRTHTDYQNPFQGEHLLFLVKLYQSLNFTTLRLSSVYFYYWCSKTCLVRLLVWMVTWFFQVDFN